MRYFILLLVLGFAVSGVKAGDLSFQVTNIGPGTVTSITATPKTRDSVEPIPVANGNVGPGETSDVTLVAPGELCVFDLAVTATNREDTLRPDIDLCQLEVLVIE